MTEDRKKYGLNLVASIEKNISLPSLDRLSRFGILNENQIIKETNAFVEKIRIKAPSIETLLMELSGGNQQKVVLAKWLMVNPRILLIDEPTRGIDVGAKYEIYTLMNELKQSGTAVVMVSSELPEILGMSDRVLVMRQGELVADFKNDIDLTEEVVMGKATGGVK